MNVAKLNLRTILQIQIKIQTLPQSLQNTVCIWLFATYFSDLKSCPFPFPSFPSACLVKWILRSSQGCFLRLKFSSLCFWDPIFNSDLNSSVSPQREFASLKQPPSRLTYNSVSILSVAITTKDVIVVSPPGGCKFQRSGDLVHLAHFFIHST